MRGNDPTPLTTSGAILAGGQARRFAGRDKSALLVEGRTILARQLEALAPVAESIVIVGPTRVPEPFRATRALPDLFPGRGPVGGLFTALSQAPTTHVVVLACDMPFVTTALLRALVEACAGHDAAVPFVQGRWHPLCACYHARCAALAARHVADDRLRMMDLLAGLDVARLDDEALAPLGDPRRLLANVNTFDDYRLLTQ